MNTVIEEFPDFDFEDLTKTEHQLFATFVEYKLKYDKEMANGKEYTAIKHKNKYEDARQQFYKSIRERNKPPRTFDSPLCPTFDSHSNVVHIQFGRR